MGGEFGHLIEQSKASGIEQFDTLYKHFQSCSQDTKALLLSTFMKFINMYDDLNDRIMSVFKSHHSAIDPEIQQRSVEYTIMAQYDDQELITSVWEAMPDFPERDSALMRVLNKKNKKKTYVNSAADDDDDEDDDDSDDDDEEEEDSSDEEEEEDDEDEEEEGDEPQKVSKTATSTKNAPPAQEQDLLSDLFGSSSIVPNGGGSGGN